jgi:hypothetical protein
MPCCPYRRILQACRVIHCLVGRELAMGAPTIAVANRRQAPALVQQLFAGAD